MTAAARHLWLITAILTGLMRGQQLPIAAAALDAPSADWHRAVPVVDGVTNGAARFDGRDARIEVGPCPVDSTSAFTLSCNIRTRAAGFCTPLMARDAERVGLSLVLGRSPGRISFEAWSWASVRLQSQVRVDDGAWHTIEVPYDPASNTAILFVDGVYQSHAELGQGGSPSARLRLGDNIGAHQPFAGDLDEVSVQSVTTHGDTFALVAPVLPYDQRAAALARLRARVLPKVTPSLAPAAAAAWPERRLAVRAHVADALGLLPPPARVLLDVEVHGDVTRDGVRLQRISWIGYPGQRATGWLWTPVDRAAGRHPAVLCPHGHWSDGAIHPVVQARCAAFARFGWTALAVDSVHVEHVASGVNSVGAMTWHNQRALDLLLARDDVDQARVAVTGASGGGQQSYYLMALEDRLAAAAPIVMACYLTEIVSDTSAHCGCNHVPRLAAGTDVPEMCAVFAPRPAFFGSVSRDWTSNFPREGLPELTAHWQRLGGAAPGSRFADEEHNYDRPMREAVYGFLHSVFAAGPRVDEHATMAEPSFVPFTRDELAPHMARRPPAVLSASTMATELLARRPRFDSLAALAPGLAHDIAASEVTWLDDESAAWRRGVARGGDDVPIPFRVRRFDGADDEPYTVVVDARGMVATMLEAQPDARRLVAVDPRPYGEWAVYRTAWQRNGILLGRGEGYQAAVDAALVCASLPGTAPVRLVGRGEASVVALLAAHLGARCVRVDVDDVGTPYARDGNRLPLCPELLRFGDVQELIASLPARCRFGDAAK